MTEFVRIGPAGHSPLAVEEFVRMRDGVHLATDVYLPAAAAPAADVRRSDDAAAPSAGATTRDATPGSLTPGDATPGDTILIRLPYDKRGAYTFIPLIAEYFTAHGYRVVAQDVRGKFRSEGETLLFVNEADDGHDTIEWITRQRWSNGRVAMWGDSYYGYTQWAAASTQHPALKAISPRVTGTMLGEPARGDMVEMGITYLYPLTYFHSQDAYFWEMDWTRRPYSAQVEDVLDHIGARSISYDLWYPRPVRLRRFPQGHPFDARPVPVLHTIGWWDNCAPLSWADVAALNERPGWAMNHFLRIEPMDHEAFYLLDAPEQLVEERTEEQIRTQLPRMLDPTLEFFDVFVRGNGSAADIPRVAWNLAGTEGMRTSTTWPPAGVREIELAATTDGGLTSERQDAAADLSWTHDPADPVPSSVENAFAFLLSRPDEAPLGERDDVLVFTAEPVAHDIDLVGPVRASATVRSDGPVMDVFVRLLDLAPDGTALRIARGQVHVRDAATPTSVEIDLGQLGYRLRAGHALRVHVSASDAPEFIPLPGTGEDPWGASETTTNTEHIAVGGAGGLRVRLGILEES